MKDVFQFRKHEQALRKRFPLFSRSPAPSPGVDTTTATTTKETQSGHISPTHTNTTTTTATATEPDQDQSLIFERSVGSRSQSFSSAIPAHLPQEAMVPSVLDATCSVEDDTACVELICGHSGHPLCKRRTTSFSGLSGLNFQPLDEDREMPPLSDVDFSDHTRLNFTSYAELVSDEEDAYSPVITRRNSVVVVPLSVKSTNIDTQELPENVEAV